MMKIACMDDNFMCFILPEATEGSSDQEQRLVCGDDDQVKAISCQSIKKDYNLSIMKAVNFTLTVQVINMMKNEGTFWNRACS